jgi:glycosyltransferase involved in cell wall biosynthesis
VLASPPLRVLHAIHDFLPRHRAGSEIYAARLAREQGRRHEVAVLCSEYEPARPHASWIHRSHDGLPVHELVNNWPFTSLAETCSSPAIDGQLDALLAELRPDVLHVHSLLNLSFRLPALARARGIACVATVHDFTLLCPSGGQRVHAAEEHVCHEIDPVRCARCFGQSPFGLRLSVGPAARSLARIGGLRRAVELVRTRLPRVFATAGSLLGQRAAAQVSSVDVEERLAAALAVVDQFDELVAPSAALVRDMERFGVAPGRIRVSDNGFPPLHPARDGAARDGAAAASDGRLRIGFVGTIVWHKGVHLLVEAMRRLPAERVRLRVFGDAAVFPDYAAKLRRAAEGLPVEFAGRFDENRAAGVYGELDVLVVPSLWPENSPLVIHEAFQAGVAVVGANVGGIPELVRHGTNGLVYDAFSPPALAAAITSLLDDPALLARLRHARTPVKTLEQDAADWERTYARVCASRASVVASGP